MSSHIRPLTHAERRRAAQLTFVSVFKNVSFQIGELLVPKSSERNINDSGPGFVKGIVMKGPTVKFPIMVPNSLPLLPGKTNIVASVFGQRHPYGGYNAVLSARSVERLSCLNSKLRTVEDLIKPKTEQAVAEEERLGKSANARVHNQVMLCGVVVEARFEDGDSPRLHLSLRQDSNPNNIIPLIYEARNASAIASSVKYASIIYVEGEYAYRAMPVYQNGEEQTLVGGRDRVPALNAEGAPLKFVQTYIRITAPKEPTDFDTDFGGSYPKWITEIGTEMAVARARSAVRKETTAPVAANIPPGAAVEKGAAKPKPNSFDDL